MKKQKTLYLVVFIILALFFAADTYFELGVVDSVLSLTDTEAPVINTDTLRSRYLLNSDEELVVTCSDNLDTTCEIQYIGDFDTSILGENTITIKAEDNAGNQSTFSFTYEIVDNYDGSIYIPLGYYDGIDGLEGENLKVFLNSIISNHVVYPYTNYNDDTIDIWDILREADEDPDNEDNVLLFYTGLSLPKGCQDSNNVPSYCELYIYEETKLVEWNREHIWSKSRGGFTDESGLDAYSDAHNLVAAERVMNSTKNNRFYEDCHDDDGDFDVEDRGYGNYTCNLGMFEPRDEVKGDVARMLFYMATRYNDETLDLELVNDPIDGEDDSLPIYGDIDDLLRWHIEDPVSEKEVLRNEVIYSYQGNRNPFIDMPELVELIWGTSDDYQLTSSSEDTYYKSSLEYDFYHNWVDEYNQILYLEKDKKIFI